MKNQCVPNKQPNEPNNLLLLLLIFAMSNKKTNSPFMMADLQQMKMDILSSQKKNMLIIVFSLTSRLFNDRLDLQSSLLFA